MVDELTGGNQVVPGDEPLVPGWLVRLAAIGWRVLVTVALGIVLFGIVLQLAVVAAAVILAMILAATLAPYVARRRARGEGRAKAAGIVSGAALLVLSATIALIVLALAPSVSAILGLFDAGLQTAQSHLAALGVPTEVTTVLQRALEAIRGFVLAALGDIVGAAADIVTIAILGGFLTFFLLVDGDRSWDWLLASTDGWRREALMNGGLRAVEQVGGYIRGTALVAAATAILAGVLMLLLGVPFAGPLAVLALLGAFIPYIGRALTAIVIVTVALASAGAVPAIALFVLFLLGSIAIDRALARMTAGRRLELHPILAVVGLPIGLALGGFGGLVVILPLLAFAQTTAGVLTTALGREPTPASTASALDPEPITAATASATSDLVPVWLDRLGQWSWRALVIAALFVLVTQVALLFPAVIMPVVIAVILAATLGPAAAALERRGVNRTMAAMAVTVGTGVTIIGVLLLTVASLIGPMADMLATATAGAEESGAQAVGIGSFAAAIGGGLQSTVTQALANFVGITIVLALGGFLTFYFIRDGARVWQGLTRVVPRERRGPLDAAGARAADILGGYMLGTAAISLVGAVSQWVIMVILGLPFAVPLTVLALFAGFIPYVGGFITTGLAFLVALAVGDSTTILIMFVYTIVFNIIQGNFVTPLVYGKAVSLHPAIILLAVPIGSALAGIVGMFLVVPVAGVIATTWRAVLQTIDTGRAIEPVPPRAATGDEIGPAVPGAVVGG